MSIESTAQINSNTRLPSLDGLRGIAIGLVLLHSWNVLGEAHSLAGRVLDRFFDLGWIGVQLFFVLSGFLITGILIDTRRSPDYFKSFFLRRSLRIFPLYYATLLAVFILLPAVGMLPAIFEHDRAQQVWFWFYLQNWRPDNWQAFPHYWSLAVEEQFYLLWPFVVHRCTSARLLKICVALALISLAIRSGLRWGDVSAGLVYTASVCRMDALVLGAAVAVVMREPAWLAWVRAHTAALLVGIAALAAAAGVASGGFERDSVYGQTVGYGVLSLGFAATVFALALADNEQNGAPWRRFFLLPAFRVLGKYSYAIYVFQRPLGKLLGEPLFRKLPAAWIGSPLVAFVYLGVMGSLVLALAWVSYRVVERPFLRLKGRFVAHAAAA